MSGDVVGSVVFERVARDAHYRHVARRLYRASVALMDAQHRGSIDTRFECENEFRNAVQEFEKIDPAVRLDVLNQQLSDAKTQGICPCCGEEPCPEHKS